MKSRKCQREDSKSQNQRDRDRETPKPPLAALDLAQARQAGSSVIHRLIIASHARTAPSTWMELRFDGRGRTALAVCLSSYLRRGLLDFVLAGEPIVQNIEVHGRNAEKLAPNSTVRAGPLNSRLDENCPACAWER